jgi:hypothetical protein
MSQQIQLAQPSSESAIAFKLALWIIFLALAIAAGVILGGGAYFFGMLGLAGCQTGECLDAGMPYVVAIAIDFAAAPMSLLIVIALLSLGSKPSWLRITLAGLLAIVVGVALGLVSFLLLLGISPAFAFRIWPSVLIAAEPTVLAIAYGMLRRTQLSHSTRQGAA